MTCYKSGGCGVYENRSCNECPASKPEYLNITFPLQIGNMTYDNKEHLIKWIKEQQRLNILLEEAGIKIVTTYCEGGYRRKNYKFKI